MIRPVATMPSRGGGAYLATLLIVLPHLVGDLLSRLSLPLCLPHMAHLKPSLVVRIWKVLAWFIVREEEFVCCSVVLCQRHPDVFSVVFFNFMILTVLHTFHCFTTVLLQWHR